MTKKRDHWQLDNMGRGSCPLCGTVVRGEPETFINYWHPVEVCRDALVLRVRELERLVPRGPLSSAHPGDL